MIVSAILVLDHLYIFFNADYKFDLFWCVNGGFITILQCFSTYSLQQYNLKIWKQLHVLVIKYFLLYMEVYQYYSASIHVRVVVVGLSSVLGKQIHFLIIIEGQHFCDGLFQ